MEFKAIIMGLIGFFLLYGGLFFCLYLAWAKNRATKKTTKTYQK